VNEQALARPTHGGSPHPDEARIAANVVKLPPFEARNDAAEE